MKATIAALLVLSLTGALLAREEPAEDPLALLASPDLRDVAWGAHLAGESTAPASRRRSGRARAAPGDRRPHGADNGPGSDDELDSLTGGRHFGRGGECEGPGAEAGHANRRGEDEVLPSAPWFHGGTAGGSAPGGELLSASSTHEDVRRIVLRGERHTDLHQDALPGLRRDGGSPG